MEEVETICHEEIKDDEGDDEKVGMIPKDFLRIHSFKQLGEDMDEQYNIKEWKATKTFVDRHNKGFFKQGQKINKRIEEFKKASVLNQISYMNNFVFLPSRAAA